MQKAYRNNAGIETNRDMINCVHATVGVVAACFPIMIADSVGQEREISSHIVDAGNLRGLHVVAYQGLFVWPLGGDQSLNGAMEDDQFANHARRETWGAFGPHLTNEDARQITQNVTGFFGILAEWSRAEKLAATNDAATPNNGEVRHES